MCVSVMWKITSFYPVEGGLCFVTFGFEHYVNSLMAIYSKKISHNAGTIFSHARKVHFTCFYYAVR